MLNYHVELEKIIDANVKEGVRPRLLLHCCCAPCASYCLEVLQGGFDVTCYFYNPNITDREEYYKRLNELKSYVLRVFCGAIEVVDGGYEPERFLGAAKGMEDVPEGGVRCFACYEMRLEATRDYAAENGYGYFATTLTVSPHKNAGKLNEIGFSLAQASEVKYLPSDFKKKGGYCRSIQLSKEYGLYRQNFCGCEFSKKQAEERLEGSV